MTKSPTEKAEIREEIRRRFRHMPSEQRFRAGETVRHHISNFVNEFPEKRPLRVAYFAGFSDEISTGALDDFFLEQNIERALPYIDAKNDLGFIRLNADQTIYSADVTSGNIRESQDFEARCVDPLMLDLILVPGLAFDQKGHRLGRGRGYYDRALGKLISAKKRPLFIGLLMDEQLIASVPREEHDVAMDFLCTPTMGVFKIV